jgi:hypothetical protein
MMTTESISLVASAINNCETETEKLDRLISNAEVSQQTIKRLEDDIADLHFNTGDLAPKARAAALTNATAYLELERADQKTLKAQVDAQSDRVVQVERRAQSLLQQVHAAVLAKRKLNVEELLKKNFDLRKLNTFAARFRTLPSPSSKSWRSETRFSTIGWPMNETL